MEPGDIITKVDGKAVERSGDLPRIIGRTKPGTKSSLQVFRRGNYRDVSVNVAEFEAEKPRRIAQGEPAPGPAGKNALGLAVSEVSEAQRRELKVKGGVQVDAVDGAAARSGIREGDVILSLDNTEITDPRQFGNLGTSCPRTSRSRRWCGAAMGELRDHQAGALTAPSAQRGFPHHRVERSTNPD